jgi:two-component system, OmpR family, response regulator ChvI
METMIDEAKSAAGGAPAAVLTSKTTRVIFVDDDDDYRKAVEAELTDEGFSVESFDDGPPMLEAVAAGLSANIVLLDWALKSAPGIDVLCELRKRGVEWPVIFLTGRNSPVYESLALKRGAADFVKKSRGMTVLAARLRLATSNEYAMALPVPEDISHCGRLSLRPRSSRVYWDSVDLGLTVTEFKIVYLLASNVGSFVTYRRIYDSVHHEGFLAGSGEHGYRTNVRSAIRRIRDKFRARFPDFDEIHTYTSFGYCWGKARPPV